VAATGAGAHIQQPVRTHQQTHHQHAQQQHNPVAGCGTAFKHRKGRSAPHQHAPAPPRAGGRPAAGTRSNGADRQRRRGGRASLSPEAITATEQHGEVNPEAARAWEMPGARRLSRTSAGKWAPRPRLEHQRNEYPPAFPGRRRPQGRRHSAACTSAIAGAGPASRAVGRISSRSCSRSPGRASRSAGPLNNGWGPRWPAGASRPSTSRPATLLNGGHWRQSSSVAAPVCSSTRAAGRLIQPRGLDRATRSAKICTCLRNWQDMGRQASSRTRIRRGGLGLAHPPKSSRAARQQQGQPRSSPTPQAARGRHELNPATSGGQTTRSHYPAAPLRGAHQGPRPASRQRHASAEASTSEGKSTLPAVPGPCPFKPSGKLHPAQTLRSSAAFSSQNRRARGWQVGAQQRGHQGGDRAAAGRARIARSLKRPAQKRQPASNTPQQNAFHPASLHPFTKGSELGARSSTIPPHLEGRGDGIRAIVACAPVTWINARALEAG